MYYAKLLTKLNYDEITELNEGRKPSLNALNDNTFFVYSDADPTDHKFMSRREFTRDYRWLNVNTDDNIVLKRK